MTVSRPVVRYHGGKWRLAPWVLENLPAHRVYVEPFGGAGSILMRKAPVSIEVYNDLNGELVNAFRVIRDPISARRLTELLRATPCAAEEYAEAWEPSEDPVEQARRTIIRGFQGHGSTAVSGGKHTGWRRRLPKYNDRHSHDWSDVWEHVADWCDRLRSVYIERRDAMDVCKQWDSPDALHYVDPPYITSTRSTATRQDGYAHEMSDADHQTMAIVLESLRGAVVLSGYRCGIYDELFAGWRRIEKKAVADHGRASVECLWIREAQVAQQAIGGVA